MLDKIRFCWFWSFSLQDFYFILRETRVINTTFSYFNEKLKLACFNLILVLANETDL